MRVVLGVYNKTSELCGKFFTSDSVKSLIKDFIKNDKTIKIELVNQSTMLNDLSMTEKVKRVSSINHDNVIGEVNNFSYSTNDSGHLILTADFRSYIDDCKPIINNATFALRAFSKCDIVDGIRVCNVEKIITWDLIDNNLHCNYKGSK